MGHPVFTDVSVDLAAPEFSLKGIDLFDYIDPDLGSSRFLRNVRNYLEVHIVTSLKNWIFIQD